MDEGTGGCKEGDRVAQPLDSARLVCEQAGLGCRTTHQQILLFHEQVKPGREPGRHGKQGRRPGVNYVLSDRHSARLPRESHAVDASLPPPR